jgi:hypothetical protein
MRKAFIQTLSQAKELSPQKQIALIAALSQLLYKQKILPGETESESDGFLSEEEEDNLLEKIRAYEAGRLASISGVDFREKMRKKIWQLMSYSYELTVEAAAEVDAATSSYESEFSSGAADFLTAFDDTIKRILKMPFAGSRKSAKDPDIRAEKLEAQPKQSLCEEISFPADIQSI